ncbi:hypothetical protein K1X76_03070 [bacterium]|nr:hypothetical protein [bacterium]
MNLPYVIAHRGASGEAPENTMKAFEIAVHQQADGVEMDVFLTADKKVVITHDEHTERLTGIKKEVRRSTYNELRELDFGEGEKIPLLDDFLGTFKNRFQVINIEIKSTGFFTDGIEDSLIHLIDKHAVWDQVYVSSFNPFNLYRMERKAPRLKTGYLVSPMDFWNKRSFFIRLSHAKSINLDHAWCNEKRLDKYRKFGKDIWLWTVNREKAMVDWLNMDVAAIITNYPARLKALRDNPALRKSIL